MNIVDQKDIEQLKYWARLPHDSSRPKLSQNLSSWYDFNLDGLTDQYDVPYITQGWFSSYNFPRQCPKKNELVFVTLCPENPRTSQSDLGVSSHVLKPTHQPNFVFPRARSPAIHIKSGA